MASSPVKAFADVCNYLQDPCHVARFQKICGVIGSFPVSAKPLDRGESGRPQPNPGLRRRLQPTEESSDGNARNGSLGAAASTQANGMQSDTSAGPDCASAAASLEPDSVRSKPLRRNSLTEEAGQEFLINNKFFFYLFTFGTELGNEMFFIIFFPFLFWNVDALVSRRLIIVWAWNLFLGQSTKDMVRWSRPASPPVVKVEVFYNSEYSMPSTHAMTGTAIPFCLFVLSYGRWQVRHESHFRAHLHKDNLKNCVTNKYLVAKGCLIRGLLASSSPFEKSLPFVNGKNWGGLHNWWPKIIKSIVQH